MAVYSFKGNRVKEVHYLVYIFLLLSLIHCTDENEVSKPGQKAVIKGQSELANGDEQAIELAKKVIDAAGGQKAWNDTRYIHWNFFGMRELLWDKWEQKVRIESKSPQMKAIIDLETKQGPLRSELSSDIDAEQLREKAYEIWVNDSYWLCLPFKLLDPGVHLTYLGKDDPDDFERIQLTFDSVGVTPENKYILSIDPNTHRIAEWAYFVRTEDEKPRFTMPWGDYQKYGDIWLSSARGNNRSIEDIWVAGELDGEIMKQLDVPMPNQ